MLEIDSFMRVKRLIEAAIAALTLDLKGITVLTEAASGAFVVTPLIAALAGSENVIAVTRDSSYGRAVDIKKYTNEWARRFGVDGRITVTFEPATAYAHRAELVTNLGFVRPINESFVSLMPDNSAIPLMWETWEFRKGDVDLDACNKRGIPVLGTCETHPFLQIFHYIGMLVLKMLFESDIEIFKSNILLIGSGHFGKEAQRVLQSNGSNCVHIDSYKGWKKKVREMKSFFSTLDAVVLVEHKEDIQLLGGEGGIPLDWLARTGARVIHVCGNVDYEGIERLGISKHPLKRTKTGYMTVTTDYVGPRPVIDLHTAGLKVGEAMVKGMRQYGDAKKAVDFALSNSPAQVFT